MQKRHIFLVFFQCFSNFIALGRRGGRGRGRGGRGRGNYKGERDGYKGKRERWASKRMGDGEGDAPSTKVVKTDE